MLTFADLPGVQEPAPEPKRTAPSETRLVYIDVLRGFDMFWLVGGGEVFVSHKL